jgi:hypothetical protein
VLDKETLDALTCDVGDSMFQVLSEYGRVLQPGQAPNRPSTSSHERASMDRRRDRPAAKRGSPICPDQDARDGRINIPLLQIFSNL